MDKGTTYALLWAYIGTSGIPLGFIPEGPPDAIFLQPQAGSLARLYRPGRGKLTRCKGRSHTE